MYNLFVPFENIWLIDLNMGYHHILMRKKSIKYTSFLILNEQYEYTRMQFGLTNAPRCFQRIMVNILGKIPFVKIYLDDVLIHSEKISEHYNHVMKVCECLINAGMSINLDKCSFGKFKIEYLGHYITPHGYYLNIDEINLYKNKSSLKTKKQLQKLIGIFKFFDTSYLI
ncbi:Retrovirus-related Pol polyprotein from transposon [Dictyocoela muelleri]|nr:Retrovirus-related Pol polyprotein from transposon [Dictyocoela muelleri]